MDDCGEAGSYMQVLGGWRQGLGLEFGCSCWLEGIGMDVGCPGRL